MLHKTVEKDNAALLHLEEVHTDALAVYQPVMQNIIDGKRVALTSDRTCYVLGKEVDGNLVADLYHTDYDFCLISMTVYPPSQDYDCARSMADMDGIAKLQSMCKDIMTEKIRTTLRFLGDVGRVLAWVWLIYKGYAETYA